ncbi:hypothetical protein PC9H_005450 [Pleurotus ostreatus]|uniref:Uncharacterized protein n=1 Tax=Pleurotus ostreatus TaxID=5322 RepID=A0A8H6ZZ13_PLEOS|nr:uncharacterized protein PC9H_005450 [Pleurotus ostreatus]KAF7433496.1 hypothetical protein PC9H_005450 [Pleurotus ostreatus]
MHGDIKEQHRRHRRSASSTGSNHASQRTDKPIPQPSGLFARIQNLRTAANTISSLSSLLPFNAPQISPLPTPSTSDVNTVLGGSPTRININVDVHTRMHSEHPGSISYVMEENESQTYAIWAGSPHPNRRRTPTNTLLNVDTQATEHDEEFLQTAASLPDPTHIPHSEYATTKLLNSHPRRSRRAQQVSPTHVKRLLSSFYEPSQAFDDHTRPSAIKPDYVNVPSLDPSPVLSDRTPPLTPDSFHDSGGSLPSVTPRLRFQSAFDEEGLGLAFEDNADLVDFEHSYRIQNAENHHRRADFAQEDGIYAPALSRSVQQGKRPLYLTEDMNGRPETAHNARDTADIVDGEEWVGLKYTIELSTRERHRTQSQQPAIEGEHSKSRASWAMLHQEVTHPAMIEEEFYHWRQWHKFLEQHEQREKQRNIGQRHSYAVQQQNSQTASQDNEKQMKEGAWWILGSKKEHKRGLSCPTRGKSFGRTVSSEANMERNKTTPSVRSLLGVYATYTHPGFSDSR